MNHYHSLEQRVAAAFLDSFPAFVPAPDAPVSVAAQQDFYALIQRLFRLLYEDPLLLAAKLHEDDAFPTRYKTGYGKPELQKELGKYRGAIHALLFAMYQMGRGVEEKLSRRQKQILSLLDAGFPQLPPAWVWMATRPGADQTAFAYCLFDRSHCYTAEIYARLLGERPFHRLMDWLQAHGYQARDRYNLQWPDYRLMLSVTNPAWSPEPPGLGYEYKIKHTGIAAQFDCGIREPVSVGLCIPGGMKPWLQRFGAMEPPLQAFVAERTKQCDGCRYCVQTDRQGKRPLACISIAHEGTAMALCPYFPGYRYSWNRLDDETVDQITAFLAFMDRYVEQK